MARRYPMPLELIGNTYGRLTVLDIVRRKGFYLLCKCECGTVKEFQKSNVLKGVSKSCGCYHKEVITKHGMEGTRFYRIWQHMRDRCNNVNSSHYRYYGGRGISVCREWEDFITFKADMYTSYLYYAEKFGEPNTTLDRIDSNGNYEKSNCRWATRALQAHNRNVTPTGKSGVKGVYYVETSGKWRVIGSLHNKEVRLGHFEDKECAVKAYEKFEKEKGKLYESIY